MLSGKVNAIYLITGLIKNIYHYIKSVAIQNQKS